MAEHVGDADAPATDWLVAGLGNPGREYGDTRHNVGFQVAECLSKLLSAGPVGTKAKAKVRVASSQGRDIIIARPWTYMNLSGPAVSRLVQTFRIELANLVVVHDDLDLPSGRIRLRMGGSSGGHRGVQSIIDSLRDSRFIRVRIGIGRPPDGHDPTEFVLERFSESERELVQSVVRESAHAIQICIEDGLQSAMNTVNGLNLAGEPPKPPAEGKS